ncbi:thiamine phosphate synthase [Candidatus Latescibacterota bacterium]
MDANINRASEGIRVIEETSRMLFDDSELTKRIKNIRHSITEICKTEKGMDTSMLFARSSENDVLREGETESEKSRPDLISIVRANASRAQEAIRALEEYTKLSLPHLSEKFKGLRFNLYDIEIKLVSDIHVKEVTRGNRLKLCAVMDINEIYKNKDTQNTAIITQEILDAGVGTLIFRDSDSEDSDFIKKAEHMLAVCNDRDVTVLFEKRLDIAMICHADGIILKAKDIPSSSCRKISGQKFSIGISTTIETCSREKVDTEADFYIIGFFTGKKHNLGDTLERMRGFVSISTVPVLVSGNISENEITAFFDCGVKGIVITPDYTYLKNIAQQMEKYGKTIVSCVSSI